VRTKGFGTPFLGGEEIGGTQGSWIRERDLHNACGTEKRRSDGKWVGIVQLVLYYSVLSGLEGTHGDVYCTGTYLHNTCSKSTYYAHPNNRREAQLNTTKQQAQQHSSTAAQKAHIIINTLIFHSLTGYLTFLK